MDSTQCPPRVNSSATTWECKSHLAQQPDPSTSPHMLSFNCRHITMQRTAELNMLVFVQVSANSDA